MVQYRIEYSKRFGGKRYVGKTFDSRVKATKEMIKLSFHPYGYFVRVKKIGKKKK